MGGQEIQIPGLSQESLEALLEALADRVASKLAQQLISPRVAPVPLDVRLVTQRQAARMLGVSRGRTLVPLIRAKKIRTVAVNGTVRIPVSEIDRVQQEGLAKQAPTIHPPRPHPVPATPRRHLRETLAAIEAIDI